LIFQAVFFENILFKIVFGIGLSSEQ